MFFKCKMCGGNVEFNKGDTVGICLNCGTKQTLPKLDDEKRANLYDRANHFRRNNDYDKASYIYEQILNEDNTDAEAYWSLVLCKYGIEYVEDPLTHKRIPTINRTQYTSIYADDDYKQALKYADNYQRQLYEEEAKQIDDIQKGILEISKKEEPFDVFICYKETDNNGRRTPDSVLANELYHLLTNEGFKVFFSRITLEDKLGQEYEPYIFAALNSAKVMVVLGTRSEYFNAPWVKNEWSRYLSLIKQGQKKTLIPAYKDMDPYDLPDEFSHLQALDMSKLGFMQDLIHGIKKIIDVDKPKETIKETTIINNTNIEPLLKRAFIFLSDGDFDNADTYFERVLDQDPECAKAYLGKLLIEYKLKKVEDLKNLDKPFDISSNYQKVLRYGDDSIKNKLNSYLEAINNRHKEEYYNKLVECINQCNNEESYKKVAEAFNNIIDYKDSKELQQQCLDKAEETRKEAIYNSALTYMETANTIGNLNAAISKFESISNYKDVSEKLNICYRRIEEIKAKQEADRIEAERKAEEERIAKEEANKKKKKIITIAVIVLVIFAIAATVFMTVFYPKIKYNKAITYIENENFVEAYPLLLSLNDYKDSSSKAESIYDKYKNQLMKNASVGDEIIFGSYEQDNNTSNGKEDIEWLVLDKQDNKILVISKYTLDCKKYNEEYVDVTWETCTLRTWLNDTFLNEAFTSDEQSKILTTNVTADKNPDYDTNPGNDTQDKIFLLSINEVNKYFSSGDERKCNATSYAEAEGVYTYNNGSYFWLRSPGYSHYGAAHVSNNGHVGTYGDDVNNDSIGVRPALWINLES